MKKYLLYLCIGFLLGDASLAALADSTPQDGNIAGGTAAEGAGQHKETAAQPASTPSNRLQVPKLAIRWGCQECPVNEKVAPLIEKAYADEAAKGGYAVSDAETAEMVITDFRQRPPGVRAVFGVFAGKDRLGVRIVYRDKERNAEDYSANAWFGMNSLCESVAKQSYEQVLSIMQSERSTRVE